jgi:DNA-binding NarL/FixJ family response regulator
MSRRRVLVVDDHRLLGESLALALCASGLEVDLPELDSRAALLEQVADDPPHLALLDLELGGEIGDGSTLVRPFVQAGTRVLILSATTDTMRIAAAIEQGAVGHVPKSVPFLELLQVTLAAAEGREVLSDPERQRLLHDLRVFRTRELTALQPFEQLTDREAQVLRALADGRNVTSLARQWFVSESTVRSQVRGVLSKLGVRSQLEAVALALRTGWLGGAPGSGSEPHIPHQR